MKKTVFLLILLFATVAYARRFNLPTSPPKEEVATTGFEVWEISIDCASTKHRRDSAQAIVVKLGANDEIVKKRRRRLPVSYARNQCQGVFNKLPIPTGTIVEFTATPTSTSTSTATATETPTP